jgi:transcriptional regulator with XRE-family HTH domain
LGDVADAAGISPQSLSDYLAGRSARPERQLAIYRAFCRLTGRAWSYEGLAEFWGDLLTEDATT